jgi:iron(III) transport system permease protein
VIAPILAIAATSFVRALGLPLVASNMTIAHYQRLLNMPLVRRSLQNSLSLALVIPTIGVAIATFFVFIKRGNKMPGRNALDYIVSIPYAIPGTVLAIAMILAWIRPVFGIGIYNTIWILYLAYLVRFTIFPMRTIGASWKQLDASLEEAGRISGASQFRTVREISFPLIRPGVASGWLLAFMPALTELTVSILLYSPRNETVGVTAFNVMQEGLVTVGSAYAMIIVIVVVALNIVVRFLPSGTSAFHKAG